MSEWQEELKLRETKWPLLAKILFGAALAIAAPLLLTIIIASWSLLFKTLGVA